MYKIQGIAGVTYQYTLKNAGLLQPTFGSNMDKPKCWVKNGI